MCAFERIAAVDEVLPGGRKSVLIDETPALLFRIGDEFYAVEDACTHDGQPMTEGEVQGVRLKCPRHGACFDITNGAVLSMPATEPLITFRVESRADGIYAAPQESS